jgi:aerobic C4-dicarboxylate transport protein
VERLERIGLSRSVVGRVAPTGYSFNLDGTNIYMTLASLSVVPDVPVAGMALILGIDKFMSEARAITNHTGNCTASVIMAIREGEIDWARFRAELVSGSSTSI